MWARGGGRSSSCFLRTAAGRWMPLACRFPNTLTLFLHQPEAKISRARGTLKPRPDSGPRLSSLGGSLDHGALAADAPVVRPCIQQVVRPFIPRTGCEPLCSGASLIRTPLLLGPYRRTTHRVLWWSSGGGLFLMNEVPLHSADMCGPPHIFGLDQNMYAYWTTILMLTGPAHAFLLDSNTYVYWRPRTC